MRSDYDTKVACIALGVFFIEYFLNEQGFLVRRVAVKQHEFVYGFHSQLIRIKTYYLEILGLH